MLDRSSRHDLRDDDFTFDSSASESLSDFPQQLLSSDTVADMVLAVVCTACIAWTCQLAMWTVQLTKWACGLF
jgi:hypothetical protein